MATERQIEANRRNAGHSTGPRTPEGKAVSSANAVSHGFSAQNAVLPSESAEDYQALLAGLEDEFQPQTTLERSLLRQLADADWRLRRVGHFESALLLERLRRARDYNQHFPKDLSGDPGLDEICLLGQVLIDDAERADPFSKLSRYEARLARRYFNALSRLREAHSRRAAGEKSKK